MSQFPKQQGHHGRRLYISPDNEAVAHKGFVSGGELSVGRQGGNVVLPGNPATVAYFDDFLGDVIADQWNYAEGDTGHNAAAVQAVTNGVVRLHLSSTATKAATSYAVLNHGLFPQWKANQGDLRIAARVKMSNEDGANVFIGLADTGAAQMPIYDTGAAAGQIALASNAVGFLYSGGDASPSSAWRGVAVNADTDRTPVSGSAPVNNTYDVLEVAMDKSGGAAHFYQNGVSIGSIASPVLATRGMVPVLAAFASEDTGNVIDMDWINISANRDTGE